MTASRGLLISIRAIEKELKLLRAKAERYKKEADEACNIGSEFIAIHEELGKIINSKETGTHVLQKLDALKVREKRAKKIMAKDISPLIEKQATAEVEAQSLASELYYMKMRAGVS